MTRTDFNALAHSVRGKIALQTKCLGSAGNTPRRGDLLRRSQMQNSSRRWTEEEYSYLRQNYQTKTHHEMAAALGRTRNAVRNRCHDLGLGKVVAKHPESVLESIREAYDGKAGEPIGLDALSAELGVTKAWISRQAKYMGLSDGNRTRSKGTRAAMSHRQKQWLAENEHPRGFAGHRMSGHTRQRLKEGLAEYWGNLTPEEQADRTLRILQTREERGTLIPPRNKATWKQGWHTVGGQRCYFRSSWEVNYAHYLEWLRQRGEIRSWEYEPTTFWFEAIKRGTRSYTPDFRVTEKNGSVAYHEVKGWMDARSKTKLKRMAKYHPDVTIVLVDAKAYRALARTASRLVPGWTTS